MNKHFENKIVKFKQSNFTLSRTIFLPLLFALVLFSGLLVAADLPEVKVRFANPKFNCPTQTYCVDVEFQANTSNQQLFGMNVRFFYDDKILEFLGMSDFPAGYAALGADKVTGPAGSGVNFGFSGPAEWINGKVQKVSSLTPPVYISTDGWTRLYSVCFHVDDPHSINIENFCPSIVWDLQENPTDPETGKGYLHGDDSFVISYVDPASQQESTPTAEIGIQYNWTYGAVGDAFGHPVSDICISTTCGVVVPLSNWALFLALGLMMLTSLFIWRKRMH